MVTGMKYVQVVWPGHVQVMELPWSFVRKAGNARLVNWGQQTYCLYTLGRSHEYVCLVEELNHHISSVTEARPLQDTVSETCDAVKRLFGLSD